MNEKNLSLKDRLKDAGTLKEKGITDLNRINEIIKDLGDEKLNEKVIAAPNREKFTKFITEYVTPASGNLDKKPWKRSDKESFYRIYLHILLLE